MEGKGTCSPNRRNPSTAFQLWGAIVIFIFKSGTDSPKQIDQPVLCASDYDISFLEGVFDLVFDNHVRDFILQFLEIGQQLR
jgi:hypothetical protein